MICKIAFIALLLVSVVCAQTQSAKFSFTIYNGTTCGTQVASGTVTGGTYATGGGDLGAEITCGATGISAYPYATLSTSNDGGSVDQDAAFYTASDCSSGFIFTAYVDGASSVGTCLPGTSAPYSVKMTVAANGGSSSTPTPTSSTSASIHYGTGTISLFNDTACMVAKGSFQGAGVETISGSTTAVVSYTSSSSVCVGVSGISGVQSAEYSSEYTSSSSADQAVELFSDTACATSVATFSSTTAAMGACVPAISGSLYGGVELAFKASASMVSSSIFTVTLLALLVLFMN